MRNPESIIGVQGERFRSVTLANGTVVNPASERIAHVHVTDGVIDAVIPSYEPVPPADIVVDCTGLLIIPSLVDIQVHFREPGQTEAETLATGAKLASAGGHSAVITMPNTTPAMDCVDMVEDFNREAQKHRDQIDLYTSACITQGRAGGKLVDIASLYNAGVRVFTDDGNAVMNAQLMYEALQATTAFPGMVVSQHCEDETMVAGGVINEGKIADLLGVQGRPAAAETAIVARDIALALATQGRYHVLHLSAKASLDVVRFGKQAGGAITAECTPQHLVLTHDDVVRLNTSGKMNPPLRTQQDVHALRQGLIDRTIDAIATDHAPHHPDKKSLPLASAPPGMLGAQHSWQVCWTYLVQPGIITPSQLVQLLSTNPAKIAGIHDKHGGPVIAGRPANLTVIDPNATVTITPDTNLSKSRNNPWDSNVLSSRIILTLKADRFWTESLSIRSEQPK